MIKTRFLIFFFSGWVTSCSSLPFTFDVSSYFLSHAGLLLGLFCWSVFLIVDILAALCYCFGKPLMSLLGGVDIFALFEWTGWTPLSFAMAERLPRCPSAFKFSDALSASNLSMMDCLSSSCFSRDNILYSRLLIKARSYSITGLEAWLGGEGKRLSS